MIFYNPNLAAASKFRSLCRLFLTTGLFLSLIFPRTTIGSSPDCVLLSENFCNVSQSYTFRASCKYSDGAIYEGDMDCNGLNTGQGIMRFPDGRVYNGQWRSGFWHGTGTYFDPAYDYRYEGQFFEGRETGRGKRVVPGRIEEGNFLNGNLNGVGQIDDRNLGIKLNGQFAAGELIRGEFTSGEKKWSGEFENNYLKRGVFVDGTVQWEGSFVNGLIEGVGRKTTFDSQGNIIGIIEGSFSKGQLFGRYSGESYDASGNFLYRESATATADAYADGERIQEYANGVIRRDKIKDGIVIEGTDTFPDGSVHFSRLDKDGVLASSVWLKEPAQKSYEEYETDILVFRSIEEASLALEALQTGTSLSQIAKLYGVDIREITLVFFNKKQESQIPFFKEFFELVATVGDDEFLPKPVCYEALVSKKPFCDVILVKSRFIPRVEGDQTDGFNSPRRGLVEPSDQPMATGSGFLVNNEGVIVTNAHVIDGCRKVLANGIDSSTEVTVLAVDGANDLALVKSAKPLGKPLTLAKANAKLMDEIFVAGYPFGDTLSKSVKVTKGIVSSVSGIGNNFSQMQIDASLQPGNSGGPVIDKTGQVVGVAVSKLDFAVALKAFGTPPENTNFAIIV